MHFSASPRRTAWAPCTPIQHANEKVSGSAEIAVAWVLFQMRSRYMAGGRPAKSSMELQFLRCVFRRPVSREHQATGTGRARWVANLAQIEAASPPAAQSLRNVGLSITTQGERLTGKSRMICTGIGLEGCGRGAPRQIGAPGGSPRASSPSSSSEHTGPSASLNPNPLGSRTAPTRARQQSASLD